MSYAISLALQKAIYQRIVADSTVDSLTNGAIYDDAPPGPVPGAYGLIGAETARNRSDKTGVGALHNLTISVVSDTPGFAAVKEIAVAISDSLQGPTLLLERGRLVYLTFDRATARRQGDGDLRRIDMRFNARVEEILP